MALRPHHDYRSWSTLWYGPDRNERGELRRHCVRFGKESDITKREAVGRFRRWYAEVWTPRYGSGAKSEVLTAPAYTVADLAKDYFAYAQTYYRKDGEPTSQVRTIKVAMEVLAREAGKLGVNAMTGPIMAGIRDRLIDANFVNKKGVRRTDKLTVKTAREYLTIIKCAFKWGRQERGTVSAVVAADVMMVAPLRKGRCAARDKAAVGPVEWDRVERTCTKLPANMKAMVLMQWHTGMRPGEIRKLRPCDVTIRADDEWIYAVPSHKTIHLGKTRRVALGPKAVAILRPYMTGRATTARCFTPTEAQAELPRIGKGVMFGLNQYRVLVRNAALKARVAVWTVNQLRHSWATRVADEYGIEAAADGLGHANVNTALIYAERSMKRASEVARKCG